MRQERGGVAGANDASPRAELEGFGVVVPRLDMQGGTGVYWRGINRGEEASRGGWARKRQVFAMELALELCEDDDVRPGEEK